MPPKAAQQAKRTLDAAFPTSAGQPVASGSNSKAPKLASIFDITKEKSYSFLTSKSHGKSFIHFKSMDPTPSARIAAFDIDGCLITPKSGQAFPKNASDWKWLYPSIPGKLRSLHEEGYIVLFLSNQAGQPKKQDEFCNKLPQLALSLRAPFHALAAFDYDEFRKPSPGLWRYFLHNYNAGVEVNMDASFYVGDAAGRKNPKDHSDTDRKMAENAGLTFHTPEEYFLSQPIDPNWAYKSNFDPKRWDHSVPLYTPTSRPLVYSAPNDFSPAPTEVVLAVGFPASGKTSLYRKYFAPAGYVHVNQDKLKTRTACLALVQSSLSESPPRSCYVDNTNPSAEVRKEYISLLRTKFPEVKIRAFYFTAPKELAKHNNVYRVLFCPEDERKILPLPAFETYSNSATKPTTDEGFDEVKEIAFRFEGTMEQLKDWQSWLDIYRQPRFWGKK